MQMRGSGGGGELQLQHGSLDTSGFSTSPPSPTDGSLLDFEHFVTRRENNQANSRYGQKNIVSISYIHSKSANVVMQVS